MCKRDKHPLIGTSTLLVRTAGSPGFPVEFGGVGELNAAFLEESRTRGGGRVPRSRKSGSPGFPVEFGGVGELNAAFLEESRTRGGGRVPRSRKSGSPGFPVEFGGVGEPNAAFLEESRTRGGGRVPRSRKSGSPGGLVAATDRIGAGSHRCCPSKCHNHSHQHRYRPDQTNYVQQRGHLYLRLGAEAQGLAILCRSGFKRPCCASVTPRLL
jgi:hypothetical protein